MAEYDFQESLVRFLTEKKVRRAVYSDDAALQSEMGLLPEHIDRLKQVDPERAEFFVGTIIHKRIDDVTRYIPYTNKIFSSEVHALAHEFFSSGVVKSNETFEYSLAFAEYLKNEVISDSFPPFMDDLLYYETNKLKLFIKIAKMPRDDNEFYLFKSGENVKKILPDSFDFIPVLSPYHTVLNLKSDLFELFSQVEQGNIPESIPKTDLWILIYLNHNGRIGQRIINPPTMEFIKACNGKNDLSEITQILIKKSEYENEEFIQKAKGECLKLCQGLIELGVISPARINNH